MIDPIDPTKEGYILDVKRLRKLINDPKYTDDMEVHINAFSKDLDDCYPINMSILEFLIVEDEPENRLVITYDLEEQAKITNEMLK